MDLRGLMRIIQINVDRAEGYKRMIRQVRSTDLDLATLFTNLSKECRQNVQSLSSHSKVVKEHLVMTPSALRKKWSEFGPTPSRLALLLKCEEAEKLALTEYGRALQTDQQPVLDDAVIDQVKEQQSQLITRLAWVNDLLDKEKSASTIFRNEM